MNENIPKIMRILKEYYIYEKYVNYCRLKNKDINFIFNSRDSILLHFLFCFQHESAWYIDDNDWFFWREICKQFKACYWNDSFHLNEFESALEDLVILFDMI